MWSIERLVCGVSRRGCGRADRLVGLGVATLVATHSLPHHGPGGVFASIHLRLSDFIVVNSNLPSRVR